MKVTVMGSTNKGTKEDFNIFGGHCAGICYMPDNFEKILTEKEEKTLKRVKRTMVGGHHSVFDHCFINLYIEGIPKFVAMLINNEKMYVTSEKSARYTVMKDVSELEKTKYEKWKDIFQGLIGKEKLAMENARYLISAMTPTSMAYTVSYRQINYLYQWLKKEAHWGESVWGPACEELCNELEKTGFIEEEIKDQKQRSLSMLGSKEEVVDTPEYFGDVYSTCYMGSLAQLAQAQRHKTLDYKIWMGEMEFYVPPIIAGSKYEKEWLEDYEGILLPQGGMYWIRERGTKENFILKCKERLCSAAQLEIAQQTKYTLEKYINNGNKDLDVYNHGARCTFPDFTCTEPCGWAEGIKLERKF